MKNAVFIIPYFGRFNNYFQLFLQSCGKNPAYDWLIFTDDDRIFNYPDNVHVKYTNFNEIRAMFQMKFNFKISLERAYKLCDYRAAYGYLFEEHIRNYRMWGYCDTDMIWGNISHFITDEMISKYDKIGIFGHCTLYRNTYEINRAFMQPLYGQERYKEVFSKEQNFSFDEEFKKSINNIFIDNGLSVYEQLPIANIYTKSSDFRLTSLLGREKYIVEKKQNAFFVWDNGRLYRYVSYKGNIARQEYLYIHMQSRRMDVNIEYPNTQFKIIPNAFDPIEYDVIDDSNFNKIRQKYFNLHYFKLRSRNLVIKIKIYFSNQYH